MLYLFISMLYLLPAFPLGCFPLTHVHAYFIIFFFSVCCSALASVCLLQAIRGVLDSPELDGILGVGSGPAPSFTAT